MDGAEFRYRPAHFSGSAGDLLAARAGAPYPQHSGDGGLVVHGFFDIVADVVLQIQEWLRGRQAKAKLPIAAAVSQPVQI